MPRAVLQHDPVSLTCAVPVQKISRRPNAFMRVLFCLALFSFLHLQATSVRAPSFDALVDRADLVFTGQVLSQHCEWRVVEGRRSIVTLVSFGVERWHKGTSPAVVTLQFLGGTMGEIALSVSEMPKFKVGERTVLFVEGNGVAACPVIGFFHGRFSLKRDNAGREIVLKHDGEPLTETADVGREARVNQISAAPKQALSHDDLSAVVRARVAAAPRK